MRVVILQPSYIPWLGFFDQLYKSDILVIYDDVLYTKNDWRNRNRIRLANGVGWLTIPVRDNKRISQKLLIKDVMVRDEIPWRRLHLKTIEMNYKKTPFFDEIYHLYENVLIAKESRLINICMSFINAFLSYTGLVRKIVFSSDLIDSSFARSDRLLEICRFFKADEYLSGNAAKEYLDKRMFKEHGIDVLWQNYEHPYYDQKRWGSDIFISHLSVLDLLFNHGKESLDIIINKKRIIIPPGVKIIAAEEYSGFIPKK